VIDDAAYLALFGYPGAHCSAAELWSHLVERMPQPDGVAFWHAPLKAILEQGTLSRRILRALGDDASRARIDAVYRELCDCLARGTMFLPRA
jgi:hypothetical protein